MLLRCCLIQISVIVLRCLIYLLYLCPCLHLGLFMSYLRESVFIFVFIFIMANCIISWRQTCLFFCLLLFDDNVVEECQWFSDVKSSASGWCLAFAWFFVSLSLVLLIKVLLIKKHVVKRIGEKLFSC